MSVAGRSVVITGASSGIGKAIAELLTKNGANVCLGARREDKLTELATEINSKNQGKAIWKVTDVTVRQQVVDLVKYAEEEFKAPVSAMINNAGVMPLSFIKNLHQDEWDRMVDVNIKGVLNGVGAVLPGMLERKEGDIINISSDAGRKLFPGGAVYCATKWAVEAFTQGLRQETEGTKIRVLSIQPGATSSELGNSITDKSVFESFAKNPLERFLDAEDVANAVLYALQQPAHCAINEILLRPTCQRQ